MDLRRHDRARRFRLIPAGGCSSPGTPASRGHGCARGCNGLARARPVMLCRRRAAACSCRRASPIAWTRAKATCATSNNLRAAVREAQPEIVFHMAAQSLVRPSYEAPVETFATNVMGTAHLLEAVRDVPSVRAVVIVTSDKCYENDGRAEPFSESAAMGGHDPYSASKGCAELVTAAYARSFFARLRAAPWPAPARATSSAAATGPSTASCPILPAPRNPELRQSFAGRSPFGHGSTCWSRSEDIFCSPIAPPRGAKVRGPVELRSAASRRAFPWASWSSGSSAAGPRWRWNIGSDENGPHEAAVLRLDCTKAREELGWRPVLGLDRTLDMTADMVPRSRSGDAAESHRPPDRRI